MKRLCFTAWISLLASLGCDGCVSALPMPGTVIYSGTTGVLTGFEAATVARARAATLAVLTERRLRPVEQERDEKSGLIVGDSKERGALRISLKRLTESMVEIRVQILYNRDRAPCEDILVAIRKRIASG
jgi:hypothetical protein